MKQYRCFPDCHSDPASKSNPIRLVVMALAVLVVCRRCLGQDRPGRSPGTTWPLTHTAVLFLQQVATRRGTITDTANVAKLPRGRGGQAKCRSTTKPSRCLLFDGDSMPPKRTVPVSCQSRSTAPSPSPRTAAGTQCRGPSTTSGHCELASLANWLYSSSAQPKPSCKRCAGAVVRRLETSGALRPLQV